MKKLQVVVATLIVIAVTPVSLRAQYYYGGGQQVQLGIDSLKICLKFDDLITQQDQADIISSIGRIVSLLPDTNVIDNFQVCSLMTGVGYDSFLDSVQAVEGIYLVEPYYLGSFNSALLVGDGFCVSFDSLLSQTEINSINLSYNVILDYELEGMHNVFVLRNTDSSSFRMLDLANSYYLLTQTNYSHPEFGIRIQTQAYKLYDYYHSYQAHTKKVIGTFNTASVWDFAGLTAPVKVAVLDDGVTSHEDLPASRVLAGRDFANNDLNPQPGTQQAHGMACAGIIGASHTTDPVGGESPNSGVISLDAHVNILPVKIFTDGGAGVFSATLAQAITWAWQNGADILSNSWGYGFLCPGYDNVTDAINSATQLGRNGKGCPAIFASGNSLNSAHVGVIYPACLASAFAVGATQLSDVRWYYSHYGSALDIVAPSGDLCLQGDVWSLD